MSGPAAVTVGRSGLVVVLSAEAVRVACAERGWSLSELARRAGISRPTLATALRGKSVRARTSCGEPTDREDQVASADGDDSDRESCRFWTTTTAFTAAAGPLGSVWAGDAFRRARVLDLYGLPRSERLVESCIGKPSWWLRRPGGGAGS
jgi:Cro/C1-type HTH DNA-binding domain